MMARGRMIDKSLSNSKKFGAISDKARNIYIMVYLHTDQEGRIKYNDLDDLIQECIPRFKNYGPAKTARAIEELDTVDLLVLYPYKDRIHPDAFAIEFYRFLDFQTIRKDREAESKIPAPPENARITPGVEREHYRFTPLLSLSLSLSKSKKEEDAHAREEPPSSSDFQVIYEEFLQVKGLGKEKAEKLTDFIIDDLMPEFPEVDAIEQVKKKCVWWRDNPITKKSNLHSQMRNWFIKAQQFLDEAKKERQVGRPKNPKPKTDWQKDLDLLMDKAEKRVLKKNPKLKGEELELKVKNARAKASQEFWNKKNNE